MMSVGDVIYNARRAKDLSQEEVCAISGISRSMISFIENGRRKPSMEMLDKLAKAMGYKLVITFEDNSVDKITELDLKGIFG